MPLSRQDVQDEIDAQLDAFGRHVEDLVSIATEDTQHEIDTNLDNFEDEEPVSIVEEWITIRRRYHGEVMGAHGVRLRDMVQQAGGSTELNVDNFVLFPRFAEKSDRVRLRGSPQFVARLKELLYAAVDALRFPVILALAVPASQHGMVIGRGGERIRDLRRRFGVLIETGQRERRPDQRALPLPDNPEDVRDVDPADLIKIGGTREGCEQAIAEIRNFVWGSDWDSPTRVIIGIAIRAGAHSQIIGPGGQKVKEIRARHNVGVAIPGGNRSDIYDALGTPFNEKELRAFDPADIVKISGTRAACENARKYIDSFVNTTPPKQCRIVHVPTKIAPGLAHVVRFTKDSNVSVEHPEVGTELEAIFPDNLDTSHVKTAAWQMVSLDQHSTLWESEETCEWKLKSLDADTLETDWKRVTQEIDRAIEATHVGRLVFRDQDICRSIQRKLLKDCAETHTTIWPGSEPGVILIMGKEADVRSAQSAVIRRFNSRQESIEKARDKKERKEAQAQTKPVKKVRMTRRPDHDPHHVEEQLNVMNEELDWE